jgi:hypothetical protein
MKELKEIVLNETKPKGWFKCDKPNCNRTFGSMQALRMHKVRVHTKAGIEGAKLGGKAAAAALMQRKLGIDAKRLRFLEAKKRSNRKTREKFWAQGLTSAGKVPKAKLRGPKLEKHKSPSQSKEAKREYYLAQKARYAAQGLDSHGRIPERFRRKRIQPIVYRHTPDALGRMPQELQDLVTYHLNRCPNCGLDLKKVQADINQQNERITNEQ